MIPAEWIITSSASADFFFNLGVYSLIILLTGILILKFFPRLSSPFQSGLCLSVMILLLLLPVGFLMISENPRPLFNPPGEETAAAAGLDSREYPDFSRLSSQNLSPTGGVPESGKKAGQNSPPNQENWKILWSSRLIPLMNLFGLIWLLGIFYRTIRLFSDFLKLKRFKTRMIRVQNQGLFQALKNLPAPSARHKYPRLYLSLNTCSPYTFGLFKANIVFPEKLYFSCTEPEIRSILYHEMSHVIHRDALSGLLQRIIKVLYWWNPLIYTLSAGFTRAREFICDNYAIRAGSARDYAHNLFRLAQKSGLASPPPIVSGMAHSQLSLEDRIRSILQTNRSLQTRMTPGASFLMGLALVLIGISTIHFSWTLNADTAAQSRLVLSGVSSANSIRLDGDRMYIAQKSSVSIFSLKHNRLERHFGRKGNLPGQFSHLPLLTVLPDYLWINDLGKILIFSKTGDFLEEIPLPMHYFYVYYPLLPGGDKYVGFPLKKNPHTGEYIHIGTLYDHEYQAAREFYTGIPPRLLPPPPPSQKTRRQKIDLEIIYDCLDMEVAEGKIFIADSSRGFYFAVFDFQGNPLYEIRHSYEKISIPEGFKSAYRQRLQKAGYWEAFQSRFNPVWRKKFPAFFSFKIADRKIYVTTFAQKQGRYELVVLDLKGNIRGRSFAFPLHPLNRKTSEFEPFSHEYDIQDNKIHYLEKKPDQKNFELRIIEIEQPD